MTPVAHVVVLVTYLLTESACFPLAGMGGAPMALNVTVIPVLAGGATVLPCHAPVTEDRAPHVSWHRPHDNLKISRDSEIGHVMRSRVRLIGDRSRGEYHLQIKYVKFPEDNGTWWCDVFNGPRVPVTVIVLVPPAKPTPAITPISGIIFQVTSEAWTFTCFAHYAHPPVKLTWVKQNGPLAEYSVLPPSVVMAPDFTMAASANLVLSPMNHGSVFVCNADHPTFMGKTHSTKIQFVVADPKLALRGGLQPPRPPPSRLFTPGDVALVVVGLFLVILVITIASILLMLKRRWVIDYPERVRYSRLPMLETNGQPPHTCKHGCPESERERDQRRYQKKVAAATVLLSVVIASLAFIIPVYIRSFSIPINGVDHIVPVMAGSMLWLDCSVLAKPTENLLEVGWRKNFMKFYNQYSVSQLPQPLGLAVNYTEEGLTLGPRTHTHGMGQVSLWPVMPSDQGLYICEVSRMLDDTGRTAYTRMTFAVIVLLGPQINTVLLVLVGVGLFAALCLLVLGMRHILRWSSLTDNNSNPKENAL